MDTAKDENSAIATVPLRALSERKLAWLMRLSVLVGSLAAAAVICVVTGLIPHLGQWYSTNSAYRRQTEALLRGSFALDADPGGLRYDMAWSEGGVEQVWGLGVPAWRLPFEAGAKLAGYAAFPDRLALCVALALFIYVLIKLLALQPSGQRSRAWPERLLGVFLLILFPPFLALCRTRFDVYEEAQAYMYLAGLGLFAATLWFFRRPGAGRFAVLGLLAGLAAFIRPTLLTYGVASLGVAWMTLWRQGRLDWRCWTGPSVFAAVFALLLVTNAYRFGSPVEFGHRLNLNVYWPMMYATRIENPLVHSPLIPRVSELFSYLFLVRTHISCCDGYAANVLINQAPVARWRDNYFSTYDLTFLAVIATSWIASIYLLWMSHRRADTRLPEAAVMGAWSLISAAPLALFYLYYPVMSSRYMMDFAPSFAVAFWALLQIAAQPARIRRTWGPLALFALCTLIIGWWGYQVSTARIYRDTGGGVATRPPRFIPRPANLALLNTHAYFPHTDFDSYGIAFNGYGWFAKGHWIAPIVVLFVRDAEKIELELSPAKGVTLAEQDWSQVRVKLGLEWLSLESSTPTATGRRLVFVRGSKPDARDAVEVVFLVLASPERIFGPSRFRIDAVRWTPPAGNDSRREDHRLAR